MFLEERQEAIVKQLKREGKVSVRGLSESFEVTEDCIRKDLAALEKKGYLKRTYGGAVLPKMETEISHVSMRRSENLTSKRHIARIANNLITSRDLVFLGISSISVALAEFLAGSEKSCTVVTDMIEVMSLLANNPRIRVLAVGGELNSSRDGFVSAQTVELIREIRPSIAFIGTKGVNVNEDGIYVNDAEDKVQKQAIIKAAERTYVMMESEKFNFVGKYRYACLDDIRGVITDSAPEADVITAFEEKEVELLMPEEESRTEND